MKIMVFLGPSLDLATAKKYLPDAEFRPPVACGDVLKAVQEKPDCIAIIDGYFHYQAAVWHKEILYAIDRGISVFGAASMGALRAAELSVYGMLGHGDVYQAFAQQQLTDDDEVAILHSDANSAYKALSDAMVDVRATLDYAQQQQQIDDEMRQNLLQQVKRCHYTKRCLRTIAARPDNIARLPAKFTDWLTANMVYQKRNDAIALLERLKQITTLNKVDIRCHRSAALRRLAQRFDIEIEE